jgi:hypothetical protein
MGQSGDPEAVSRHRVFNLPALTVGQGVLGVLFIVLGQIPLIEAESSRDLVSVSLFCDLVSFPLSVLGIGMLVYTVFLWKRKKWTLAGGFYINTFAAMLGVLEMALNGAMLGPNGAFPVFFPVVIMSAGFGSSFNKLRRCAAT